MIAMALLELLASLGKGFAIFLVGLVIIGSLLLLALVGKVIGFLLPGLIVIVFLVLVAMEFFTSNTDKD